MHCANCSMILESIEDDLPGIEKIDASYHKSTLTIEFNEQQVDELQILSAIKNKGYTVKV